MAGSGSIRFSPAVHLPSPKHIAFASPGNDAGGSILAAKVAHFLAATDSGGAEVRRRDRSPKERPAGPGPAAEPEPVG